MSKISLCLAALAGWLAHNFPPLDRITAAILPSDNSVASGSPEGGAPLFHDTHPLVLPDASVLVAVFDGDELARSRAAKAAAGIKLDWDDRAGRAGSVWDRLDPKIRVRGDRGPARASSLAGDLALSSSPCALVPSCATGARPVARDSSSLHHTCDPVHPVQRQSRNARSLRPASTPTHSSYATHASAQLTSFPDSPKLRIPSI